MDPFKMLASNVSVWMPDDNAVLDEDEGGFLIQIDHLNLTSGTKYSRAMRCQRMPQNKEQEDKCNTLVAADEVIIKRSGGPGGSALAHSLHLYLVFFSVILYGCCHTIPPTTT
jgi:hypothetical protein